MQVKRDVLNLEFPPFQPEDYVLKLSRCIEQLEVYEFKVRKLHVRLKMNEQF